MLNGGMYLTFFGEYLVGCLCVRLTVTLPAEPIALENQAETSERIVGMDHLEACDNSFRCLSIMASSPTPRRRVISAGPELMARF